MKYHALDFIACPVDKHFPLQLSAQKVVDTVCLSSPYQCIHYCGYFRRTLTGRDTKEGLCQECYSKNIEAATLFCEKCGSSYRVEDGIPKLVPGERRTEQNGRDIIAKKAEMIARARPSKEAIVSILTSKSHQLMRQTELESVSHCLDMHSTDIFLDNGAGYGIFSIPLNRQCRYVVATDITFEVLTAFKEYVFGLSTSYFTSYKKFPEDRICLIQADSCYLPFRKGFYFSKILSTEVLSHIPGNEKNKFVEEAYDYLTWEGIFVLTVGNDHIFRRLARFFRMAKAPKEAILDNQYVGYFHKFSRAEFMKLLSDCGFFINEVFGCHIVSYLPFGSNEKVARLVNKLQHTPFSSPLGDILVAQCSKKKT